MARQPDIQYIQMYNYGSTARKLEPQAPAKKKRYELPTPGARSARNLQRKEETGIVLDPLSVCAVAVAAVLLVCLLLGMLQVGTLNSRRQELEGYISTLQSQRADLQRTFDESYDLQQVERRAREMGLVPAAQARHVAIEAPTFETVEEPGFWAKTKAMFSELFAKAPG